MYNWHIPLICAEGIVTEFNGNPLTPPVEVADFADNTPNVEIQDNGGEAYPELVFTNFNTAPVVVIAGLTMTAELIAGSHPNWRPK